MSASGARKPVVRLFFNGQPCMLRVQIETVLLDAADAGARVRRALSKVEQQRPQQAGVAPLLLVAPAVVVAFLKAAGVVPAKANGKLQLWLAGLTIPVLQLLGARADTIDSAIDAYEAAPGPLVSAAAVRARLQQDKELVRLMPPTLPDATPVAEIWATANYALGHAELERGLCGAQLEVRGREAQTQTSRSRGRDSRSTRSPQPRPPTHPQQKYIAWAGAVVNTDRDGRAHAPATTQHTLAAVSRFLGWLKNVDGDTRPPSLLLLLDGMLVARFVAFGAYTRRVPGESLFGFELTRDAARSRAAAWQRRWTTSCGCTATCTLPAATTMCWSCRRAHGGGGWGLKRRGG